MASPSPRRVRGSLQGLIFTQLFALGCVFPLVSYYMQSVLHFDAMATSLVLAGSTVAAISTPLVAAFIADRVVSSRILLLICSVLAALANFALLLSQDFPSFFLSWFLMSIAQGPIGGLLNALSFHHLDNGVRDFGGVRLWGTVGWIAAGWTLSLAWLILPLLLPHSETADFKPLMFLLASLGSLGTALLALTLPRGGTRNRTRERLSLSDLVPREAFQIIRTRLFVVLLLMTVGNSIMDRFFFFGAAPYLPLAGFPEGSVMAVMTVGQLVEIPILMILGRSLTKLGFRNGLLVGLVLQAFRPLLLAVPGPLTALAGLALHGVLVGFVQTAIIMIANQECTPASRSGINQIFMFFYGGVANLIGSLGAGFLMDTIQRLVGTESAPDQQVWSWYWLGAVVVGLVFLGLFLAFYPSHSSMARRKMAP